MKKLVAIFFLVAYGFTSIGASIDMHYCMGKYVGWNLWHKKDNQCGKCGMKEDAKKKGCCKDEHKQVKLKAAHQKAATVQYFQLLDAPALVTPIVEFSFKEKLVSLTFPVSNAPPKTPRERLYILHCVFLI